MRAVLAAGLTPALGIYHRSQSNSFALADDLIEPFRPAVDYVVANIDSVHNLDSKRIRKELLQSTMQQFSASGKTIPSTMVDLAQEYGMYVEGDVRFLSVPVWSPKGA